MARNGSGVHSRAVADYINGTVINEVSVNAEMDDFSSEISNSIAADGQTTITANIPMNSKKLTGLTKGSARGDSASVANIADGTHTWITAGGTADVITGGMSPAITAYTTGMRISFAASGANTTNVTLNVDSVGAKAITKHGTTALVAGDIKSGQIVTVVYDGTQFLLETLSDQVTDNILDGTTNFTKLDVDNITIDTNTISSTNTNGDIILTPDGTGLVKTDNLGFDGNTISSTDTAGDINITPDTTGDLVLDGQKWPQADGSARQILRTDGAGQLSYHTPITLAATQATTSGTAIDFTSIPAGTKRIKLFLSGVSLSGTDTLLVQLGDSGGFETTGYSGITSNRSGEAFYGGSGFELNGTGAAAIGFSGVLTLDLADAGHVWAGTSIMGSTTAATGWHGTGLKTLSGELTQVRLTRSGSDTFDGGSASLSYE